MRQLRAKSEPARLRDMLTDSFGDLRSEAHRGPLLKVVLISGGVAALTAGSAAISSLRRRIEAG